MDILRTRSERLSDVAVLIALWDRCAPAPRVDAGDRLRQMKLAFLAAYQMHQQRLRGLHLAFYRWTWGPMSNEVYDVWDLARQAGLLDEEEALFLTPAGESFAHDFYTEVLRVEENVRIREVLDRVAGDWRNIVGAAPLLDHVYAMEVPSAIDEVPRPIREIPKGIDLFEPPAPSEALSVLHVPDPWLETLALTLSHTDRSAVARAEDDFRAGRVHVA